MRDIVVGDAEREFFEQHSYLVMPGLFADQIEEIREAVETVLGWEDGTSPGIVYHVHNDPEKGVGRVEQFIDHPEHPIERPESRFLAEVLNGQGLRGILSDLSGHPAFIYKDRINSLPPGGTGYNPHQDEIAYVHQRNSPPSLNFVIAVSPMTKENGCLQVDANWPLDRSEILDNYPAGHRLNGAIVEELEEKIEWVHMPLEPGSSFVFTGLLPHRSQSNATSEPRQAVYSVFTATDRYGKYARDKREQGKLAPDYTKGNAPLVEK